MDTLVARLVIASVTGARHHRLPRNGQDAASSSASDDVAVVVVCDGCSSGASSEVGARLGTTLFARSLVAQLRTGAHVADAQTWAAVRGDVVRALTELLERMPGDRERVIRDLLLFTIVAAAVTREGAAVWALGDGAYWFGNEAYPGGATSVLGPFADNAPPYLAYDLLGEPHEAHFDVAPGSCDSIVVATDGVLDLDTGLERFAADRYLEHPDALRRELALLARPIERIDWDERRVVRTPAVLQDDCAIGVLRWRAS